MKEPGNGRMQERGEEMEQWEVPAFLQEKLKGQYGEGLAAEILQGYKGERPVTLRVNTLKTAVAAVEQELEQARIGYQRVSWSEEAFVLEGVREQEVRRLAAYEKGEIYLQSLSSMLPPLVLSPAAGESVLDMAAAPGGKTTQMAALSGNMASITACERNKIRAGRLRYNIEKQGASRVCMMIEDARKLDDFFSFDKILLDAPCSGSGTLEVCRQNSKNRLDKELLKRCSRLQEELLLKALKLLKPGHEMVYSTCSVLAEENEQVVKRVLSKTKAEIVPVDRERFSGVLQLPVSLAGTMCICPDSFYEGFFVAKIKRLQ